MSIPINAAKNRIEILAGNTRGNVRLFHYDNHSPIPYDFDPEDIKNQQLLPAIIETIMYSPRRAMKLVELSNFTPSYAEEVIAKETILEFYKESGGEFNIAPEEQLHIMNARDRLDKSIQYFVVYSGKQLSLTSDRCFEPPVTAGNTRP